MALIYDSNNNIFIKQDYQKHFGGLPCSDSESAESFYTNKFITPSLHNSDYFKFDTPMYYTLGGTTNYYGQDYFSVFTNIFRPFIKFIFTANTSSFGNDTIIKHNIYKIPYKDYVNYTAEAERRDVRQDKNYKTEITNETTVDNFGVVSSKKTERVITTTNAQETLAPDSFLTSVSDFNLSNGINIDKLRDFMTHPVSVLTATTSGISTDTYILFPDERQKNLGDFDFQLFEDYGQYFITTQFIFQCSMDTGLTDFYQIDSLKNLISIDYQQMFNETTPTNEHIITGGTFSGTTVYGNFFTYFLIPNKPKIESPQVTGQLSTFAPTFFWSHVDDGDSYLIQVVYNQSDSESFSGTVYSYPVSKKDSNLSTEEMLNSPEGDWSLTQKTVDVIRKYSIPLWKGKTFWYRIGNIKEMVNLFGVKQSVITFSDIYSATTYPNTYRLFINVKADSPHLSEISPWVFPEYLDEDLSVLDKFSLSGSVSGETTVTGATMQLIYPNLNYETTTTDMYGNYVFENLNPGAYTLNTFYRGYQQDSKTLNITGDTTFDLIRLRLIWGNNWDTWGQFANIIPYV